MQDIFIELLAPYLSWKPIHRGDIHVRVSKSFSFLSFFFFWSYLKITKNQARCEKEFFRVDDPTEQFTGTEIPIEHTWMKEYWLLHIICLPYHSIRGSILLKTQRNITLSTRKRLWLVRTLFSPPGLIGFGGIWLDGTCYEQSTYMNRLF